MTLYNRFHCSLTVEVHKKNEQILKECYQDNSDTDSESEISDAFATFDEDNDGYLTRRDLRRILGKMGVELTSQELDEVIKEADQDGDGKLNLDGKFHKYSTNYTTNMTGGALVQWLKLPAWKVVNRRFVTRSGIQVSKIQK